MIAVTPNPDGVPLHLTTLPRWLLWREETRINRDTGLAETTKPPISYRTGKKCDVNDPREWTDFASVTTALTRSRAWDGSGFVLGEIVEHDEWVIGADLDECLDDDGALSDWAKPFLFAFGTYTDHSPGGRGLKCVARIKTSDMPTARKLLGLAENEHARTRTFGEKTDGHHVPGIQIFLAKRYFTITGRRWFPSPEDVTVMFIGQVAQLGMLLGPRKPILETPSGQRADEDETEPDETAIRAKLEAAFLRNPSFKARWEGGTTGLNDTSRSGFDISIAASLIIAGFTKGETRAALRLFKHGKLTEEEAAGRGDRYFNRMWTRSGASPHVDPEPPADWEDRHPPRDELEPSRSDDAGGQPEPKANRPSDDEAIERLAKLPVLEYERQRASEAGRLGCRAQILDRLVQSARSHDSDSKGQGRVLQVDRPEPWGEPVDGAELLDALAAFLSRHVFLPPGAADALAAWTVHTYCFDTFRHSPRVAFTSPEKRCGKTTALDALALIVCAALPAANVSTAAVFRTIELVHPTLLIDEADTFLRDNDELRGVLNAGHKQGGQVIRCVGDDAEPRAFGVFGPAAIAAIGDLPPTLADRSLVARMQRATRAERRHHSMRLRKLKHQNSRASVPDGLPTTRPSWPPQIRPCLSTCSTAVRTTGALCLPSHWWRAAPGPTA